MDLHRSGWPPPTFAKSRRLASLPLPLLVGALPALLLLLGAAGAAPASGTVTDCGNDVQLSSLLAGGGPITFNCGPHPVTITLTGQKVIGLPTQLDGGGLVTLSGGGVTRLFSVTVGASLSLANLTLYNGRTFADQGGAIYNMGDVTLVNTTVASNTAGYPNNSSSLPEVGGGVFNGDSGRLTITQSAFVNNLSFGSAGGAGIYSSGALTVSGSTFTGNQGANRGDGGGIQTANGITLILDSKFLSNTAGFGGALDNDDSISVTVVNSVLAYNLATVEGGAIDSDGTAVQTYISDTFAYNLTPAGPGGAIWNHSYLTIQASTFVGNRAGVFTTTDVVGGAIYNSYIPLTLTNSTFYDNFANQGGALYNNGSLTVTNSTLFSNTASLALGGGNLNEASGETALKNTIVANGSPTNCVSTGALTSRGHNLESANACGLTAALGDFINTNPLLGPLSDDGGPTLTLPLRLGSPAIDRGDNAGCPATDQRGGLRPINGLCDIGAFEFSTWYASLYLPLVRR